MFTKLHLENGESLDCSKIICIARNYAEHIEELKNTKPKRAIFFMKPNSALINQGKRVLLPEISNHIHHEIELALVIGKDGHAIPEEKAEDYILGYGVALDLTARDIQNEMKENAYSWEMAKAFDQSCPISTIRLKEKVGAVDNLKIELFVNNELRQSGNSNQMIYKIPQMIAEMSRFFTLKRGDVILTGTPKGVGEIHSGDVLHGTIESIGELFFEFV